MFADDETPPEIKVVDRRRFIQEGSEVHENPDAAPERPAPPEPETAFKAEPPLSASPAGTPAGASPAAAGASNAAAHAHQATGGAQLTDGPSSAQPAAQAGTQSASAAQGDAEKSRKDSAQRQADQVAAGLPPADFMTLTEFLAQQVSTYLGEPDPMGRAMEPNLPVAAMFIDLLGVLQEKTKGNLSLDESRLLDQLLYALRLQYVQRRR
jgi:hypothetical protein